jgi:hypothetical protein
MTIATALLQTVKERELDHFFTMEEDLHKTVYILHLLADGSS